MRARVLALWMAAVLATVASLVVHLTLRFETVRLGYEVSEARRVQRDLTETRRLLMLEAATLREADRVESVARTTLGMDTPAPPRIIAVDGAPERAPAGRTR
jgi:cell division protein FtsL